MPAIPAEQWTDAQRAAAAEISSGPRGGVVGPFIAALRSPECMRRLQHFGAYLRYDSNIPPRLRETTTLRVHLARLRSRSISSSPRPSSMAISR